MPELFSAPHWAWWTLAAALIVIEILAPGTFFLWMGVAAALVGLLVLLLPELSWQVQALVWALLSVSTIGATWLWLKRHPRAAAPETTLNRRGQQYVGRVFTLTEDIVNGRGRLRVDDTLWRVEGPDCAAGVRVKVVGVDGVVLKVERNSG
ncbi:MAG TPA: NfeD family protein [Candidatus Competibacteraceae bacterium]|nr:NfeD family protein [Candidatus Competibacteraceae bacterium]